MNCSKWFVKAEECFSIKNLFLFHITPEIVNDIETDEKDNYWKYHSFEHIRQIIQNKYAIPFDAFVGLYTRGELTMAARFAWLLYWIGYERIGIIIGKFDVDQWKDASLLPSVVHLPMSPRRPNVRLTCSELFDDVHFPTTQLLDVRTWEEYSGRTTGYAYVRHAGRIPHFLFDPLDGIYEHLNGDILWNDLEDYLRLFSTIHQPNSRIKRIVYMCGTGWRASLAAIFALESNLADTITVLDSGWYEWSERYFQDNLRTIKS